MSDRVSALALLFWGQTLFSTCGFCRSKGFSGLRLQKPNLFFLKKSNMVLAGSRSSPDRIRMEIIKYLRRFTARNQ